MKETDRPPSGSSRGPATPPARNRRLLAVTLLAFSLWLVAVGPARAWARQTGLSGHWIFGVAPSFFAAVTFAHWQAYRTRTGPIMSAGIALAFISLAEVVQLILPRYTADLGDVLAGAVGAALAAVTIQRLQPPGPPGS